MHYYMNSISIKKLFDNNKFLLKICVLLALTIYLKSKITLVFSKL